MSFSIAIRQAPPRLAQRIPQLIRAIHTTPKAPLTRRTATSATTSTFFTARNAFRNSARSYIQQATPVQGEKASPLRKMLVSGAIFSGTLVAINAIFNRKTRDNGGMPAYKRKYLNDTFLHTSLSVSIITLSARQIVQSGFVYRLMVTNPYIPKYALWTAFNATQAAMIAPLIMMVPSAILARASLYTITIMGSLSIVSATAKQDKYLYIGGPLLAGLSVVIASSFTPIILPATAICTLTFTKSISLYSGLTVFSSFTLYDVQKILYYARLAERGVIHKDAINKSITLELDFINIFVRMVQILMMQNNRRK